jgi:hypothetical protein
MGETLRKVQCSDETRSRNSNTKFYLVVREQEEVVVGGSKKFWDETRAVTGKHR